ncbi:peroxisomal (S)-2-hydroxyacid oxidase GLO4-like [Silene latifolia]|uniref:peroxisomal (S)-2-hydroxyacid oxidase GLO4-like n=1 Tax=Silene latifolia TaxID=37657 RepID=UPI003D7702D6
MTGEPVNVNEFQELARRALPKMYYDFFVGAAEDEHTLRENVKAFSRIMIRPRILIDVSRIDLSTSILGYNISSPIMIAPTSYHKLAHPQGEIATAKAAAAHKTIMVLSFSSTSSLEEVSSCCDAVRFFQLYVFKDRKLTTWLIQRAERSGYKAIVLTVDTPKLGRREADIKNKMIAPQLKNLEGFMSTEVVTDKGSGPEAFANSTFDASLSWKDIDWLRSVTKLPILVKGILTNEDATKAVEMGVDGIIVSNHGARQLNYAPATISVLQEVVHAVGGKIPVLFDGGVRRGTDVFKALALGAQAVLIGRPIIFGLAAKGENGVKSVLGMLKDELELTMALAGCTSIKDITRAHVTTERDKLQSLL